MNLISIPKLSTIYISIWGGSLFLFSLNLVTMLKPISFHFLGVCFFIPTLMIFFCEYIFSLLFKAKQFGSAKIQNDLLKRSNIIHTVFITWATLSVIDFFVSGFLPIFGGGASGDLNYTDYGVKLLGGINNAFALTLVFSYSMLYLYDISRKRSIYSIASISIWQILTLRRGILFSIIIIFLLLYLFKNFKQVKYLGIKICVLGFSLISLFGVLGDIRGIERPFTPFVREQYIDWFNSIPSGFLWVYVYITTSLQNLYNNLDLLYGDCSDVFFPLLSLAPSIVRPMGKCDFYLESEYLNVGSYLSLYIVSGNIISFLIYLAVPIVFTTFVRQKFVSTNNVGYLGVYTVLLLCWILSPFTNLFFLPTYVFCPILLLGMFLIRFDERV